MAVPLTHRSYDADLNPFMLAAPPVWWLNGLAAFDADLVVMPSRQRPVHWLVRRRKLSADYAPKVDIGLLTDSAMFRKHGVIDVTWFASLEGFTEGLLLYLCTELAERDTWAINGGPMDSDKLKVMMLNGGVTKFTKLVDEQDKAAEAKLNQQIREDLYHSTGEAWRIKQYLTGETSRPFEDARPAASSPTLTPDVTAAGAADKQSDAQPFTGEV